jgi:NADH-quinone oxidoreductase subunit G
MAAGIEQAGRGLAPFLQHGSDGSVRCLGGPYQSLESMAMLSHLCRTRGWQPPVYFEDGQTRFKVLRAVKRLDETLACSMREIEHADAVLAIGVDPLQEAPMLALAMRQAFCKGAPVVVLDPRPGCRPAAM